MLQRAGYHFDQRDPATGEDSYSRRAGAGEYPKFHVYFKQQGDELILNLHLDQKRASYGGYTAHSGEYEDSEILEKEAGMLKFFFGSMV